MHASISTFRGDPDDLLARYDAMIADIPAASMRLHLCLRSDDGIVVVDTVYVSHNTPTIDGITTVEVRDRVYESGTLTEDTLDWYAQDDHGNVWYLGELSTQLPDGTHTGSWTAGVNGAQPGYIMEANPAVGDAYCQENAPGAAQDAAQVLSLTASRSVPYGTFSGNVLQTKDYSLIEPHSEHKFYAPGVGMLEALALNGGSEDIQLYTIQHNQ